MIPGITPDKDRIIAATGAGGKTCFLQHLARLLQKSGKRVLLSTTTHIYHPNVDGFSDTADRVICCSTPEELYRFKPKAPSITVAGMTCDNRQKLSGIPANLPAELLNRNLYDNILIEADGSRQLPLKAPAENEPVLPEACDVIVAVTGWKGIESPMTADTVHRQKHFSAITGLHPGDQIKPKAISALINSPSGLFKYIFATSGGKNIFTGKKIWLLNQLDTLEQWQKGRFFAQEVVASTPSLYAALLSSFSQPCPWLGSINISSYSEYNND